MKVTGEHRNTQRKTCRSVTLSTTNPTWTPLGLDPGLQRSFETSGNLTSTDRNISEDLNFLVKYTVETNICQTEERGNVKDMFQNQQYTYESMKQICAPNTCFVFHFATQKVKD
jgi:hypothetical protein